jgi:hypothetical protein
MDFYKILASEIFGVAEEDVTPQQRQQVKHGLFMTLYKGKIQGQDWMNRILGQFISDSKNYIFGPKKKGE